MHQVLGEFRDAMTIVGGSAPPLLLGEDPDDPYVGTTDVDLVLDPKAVPDDPYVHAAEALRRTGYRQDESNAFRWYRTVPDPGGDIEVEVDLLAPRLPGRKKSNHEKIGAESLARRTVGAELVRSLYASVKVSGQMVDGRNNTISARVASAGALLVLKAIALGRRSKDKDAYDIDYILQHAKGGPVAVAAELRPHATDSAVVEARGVLGEKFANMDGFGPQTVARYRRLTSGTAEADEVQARAFAAVQEFLRALAR